ncbi:PP2C family protein-serine/threonine phosphatase [Kitasatospora sp. NPDC088391]|uniref:PP2C family protein-serine/threonine phosphatase n=1 Tax=Kitasatospora sp. NPDC088391 TaxID=3364074 RepID=UPI00382ECF55
MPATRAASLAAAAVLYALVVVLQVTTDNWHIPSVLVAVPAVVALGSGPATILAAAAVAVATRWAFALGEPGRTATAVGTTAAVLGIAALGCFVVRRRERAAALLVSITSVAESAQRAVLRPVPAAVGPVAIAAGYRAAAEHAGIGGDFYAVADTAFGLRVLIGDVRGKGLDAVTTAAAVLGAFYEAAHDEPGQDALAGRLDTSLRRFLTDPEGFATAALVDIAPDGSTRALSCGHPPPLLLRGAAVTELPAAPGLPLGLGVLGAAEPEPGPAVRLRPGDVLLLYTDGLSEARDASGAFYPLLPRLAARPVPAGPQAVVDWLRQDADRFAGGVRDDDSALLVLAWEPAGHRP